MVTSNIHNDALRNKPLTTKEIGTLGEALVKYRLLSWGIEVVDVSANQAFDLITINKPCIRIQVKAALKEVKERGSYKFTLKQGSKGLRYKHNSYDILAFVALDRERVLFYPFIEKLAQRVKPTEFTVDNELLTWQKVCRKFTE